MSDFPKWLLALAGTNLIPVLLCPFFLFGGLRPFGESEYMLVNALCYLLLQALWLLPILLFFASLHLWRECYEQLAVGVAVFGLLLVIADIVLLLSA